MAVWLSGGAARIVLRIKVEQEITREGLPNLHGSLS